MKHSLLCSSKRVLACVSLLILLSGCGSTPVHRESPQRVKEPPALPRDYESALALMQSGDYQTAIPALQRFIDSQPELAGPWLNLGIAYRLTGNTDSALQALKKAVELNPENAAAWQQLGMLHRQRGEFEAALASYTRALQLEPAYALAHRNIGILYDLYLQQPGLALQHYRRYLELSEDQDAEVSRWVSDLQRRSGGAQARAEQ